MEPSRWVMGGDCRIITNTERLIVLGEYHALCTLNTSFVDFEKSRCIAASTKKDKQKSSLSSSKCFLKWQSEVIAAVITFLPWSSYSYICYVCKTNVMPTRQIERN
jgi:hypothetical protein